MEIRIFNRWSCHISSLHDRAVIYERSNTSHSLYVKGYPAESQRGYPSAGMAFKDEDIITSGAVRVNRAFSGILGLAWALRCWIGIFWIPCIILTSPKRFPMSFDSTKKNFALAMRDTHSNSLTAVCRVNWEAERWGVAVRLFKFLDESSRQLL